MVLQNRMSRKSCSTGEEDAFERAYRHWVAGRQSARRVGDAMIRCVIFVAARKSASMHRVARHPAAAPRAEGPQPAIAEASRQNSSTVSEGRVAQLAEQLTLNQ